MSRFREVFDWLQMIQRRDDSVEVQIHVLMDQHVPEPGKGKELPHQGWGHPGDLRQRSDGIRIVLKAQPISGRKLTGDVDDELADGQQGVENVIVKGQVLAQSLRIRHSGPQSVQVVNVSAQLGQAFDEPAHRLSASSLMRLILASQGARSAACSWTFRAYARSASGSPRKIRFPS